MMITVRQIFEASSNKSVHLLYVPKSTGTAVSHQTATNLRHFASQKGEKAIATSDPNIKKSIKTILPHHDHKLMDAPTIYHALDTLHGKGHKNVILHAEPSNSKMLEDKVNQSHGSKFDSISVKTLPHDFGVAKNVTDVDPSIKRTDAKKMLKTESFEIGQIVKTDIAEGEVIFVGPTYLTIVSEGKETKVWKEGAVVIGEAESKNRIYKESYTYKGYKTKNITRELAEHFRDLAKTSSDPYALLNCIKACDYILGVKPSDIVENYNLVKIQFERAKRYSNKFSINISEHLQEIEKDCLRFAIIEGYKFATTDKTMVARVIASVAEINPEGSDPLTIVNNAVIKLRQSQLTTQGWELVGRLMKVATKAGIRWNKDAFTKPQQTMMGI